MCDSVRAYRSPSALLRSRSYPLPSECFEPSPDPYFVLFIQSVNREDPRTAEFCVRYFSVSPLRFALDPDKAGAFFEPVKIILQPKVVFVGVYQMPEVGEVGNERDGAQACNVFRYIESGPDIQNNIAFRVGACYIDFWVNHPTCYLSVYLVVFSSPREFFASCIFKKQL